jgi:hypothetical protein
VFTAVAAALVLASCSSPPPPTPTPDPRIDEIERAVERIGPAVERMDQAIGRLEATPTPSLTPSPAPTLDDFRDIVAASLAEALDARPTPTAVATPMPGLTLRQIERLVDDRVGSAIASLLPPVAPERSATAVVGISPVVAPQVSGPASASLGDGVTLAIEPGLPLTGRDVRFAIFGLTPWQRVAVEFVDPSGRLVQWISDDEATLTDPDGGPLLKRILFADETGTVRWRRIGALDREGVWSVRITTGGRTATVTYPLVELQLPGDRTETVGVELRRHNGIASNTYYSFLVASSLALDLQSHLAWVIERVEEDLGLQALQIPDVYLVGNGRALEDISRAVGVTLGLEDGYYKPRSPRAGIYLRTDFQRSEVQRILTHEYIHLVVVEAVGNVPLPAWLSEGLSSYLEFDLAVRGERPDSTRRWLYASAELAQSAAVSGALMPLTLLESQRQWAERTDPSIATLQYSQAHMIARFLAEEYGPTAGIDIATGIAEGATLTESVLAVTGVSYGDFQELFEAWLVDWSDPVRDEVEAYLGTLGTVMTAQAALFDRREAVLASQPSPSERVAVSQALAADSGALLEVLSALSAPSPMEQLHDDAVTYLDRLALWLTLEWEFVNTRADDKRRAANGMILEIDARRTQVLRAISDMEFRYYLDP